MKKLVAEVGVGTVAAGVAKAHADVSILTGAVATMAGPESFAGQFDPARGRSLGRSDFPETCSRSWC